MSRFNLSINFISSNIVGDVDEVIKSRERYKSFWDLSSKKKQFPTDLSIGSDFVRHIYTEERVTALENWIKRTFKDYEAWEDFAPRAHTYGIEEKYKSPGDYTFSQTIDFEDLIEEWLAFKRVFGIQDDIEWFIFYSKHAVEVNIFFSKNWSQVWNSLNGYTLTLQHHRRIREAEIVFLETGIRGNTDFEVSGYPVEYLKLTSNTIKLIVIDVDLEIQRVYRKYIENKVELDFSVTSQEDEEEEDEEEEDEEQAASESDSESETENKNDTDSSSKKGADSDSSNSKRKRDSVSGDESELEDGEIDEETVISKVESN